jgi:hypothetical protein
MKRVQALLAVLLCAVALISSGGCSVGSALGQPAFVDFREFKLGETRLRMSELIGAPKSSTQQSADNHFVDYHEFRSGTPGATRLRVVGYIAGDLFTLGLAEIVFWPVELTIAKPRDFKAHFAYDPQEHVNGYRIVFEDGTVAKQEGTLALADGTPNVPAGNKAAGGHSQLARGTRN